MTSRSIHPSPPRSVARLIALACLAVALAGCAAAPGASGPASAPSAPSTSASSGASPAGPSAAASSATPAAGFINVERMWANGALVTMDVVSQVSQPAATVLANAPAFYVLGFPLDQASGKAVVPAAYTPQCDPCLQAPNPQYHDHVLADASATPASLAIQQAWRPTVLMYTPAFITGGHFAPVTREQDLAAAIAAHEFLPIGPGGAFEKPLPVVLILKAAGS